MGHDVHTGRHEHAGMSSRGDFDGRSVLVKAGLRKGHLMIDAGCGDGHLSLAASEIVGRNGSVHALDVHGPSIDALKSTVREKDLRNIHPGLVDITNGLPFPNGVFDMVLISNVLHGLVHNREETLFLNEVERVLRPGGKFTVIEFRKEVTAKGPPLEVRLSIDDIKGSLKGTDLIENIRMGISSSHYMAIFIRPVE